MIDLHIHTSMSDGTFTPREVVNLAIEARLSAIAITDHDTVAGVFPAQEHSKGTALEVISGVEISTEWDHGILHILGYGLRIGDSALQQALDFLVRSRVERIPQILDKLKAQNVHLSSQEVDSVRKDGVPGRPHVANALVRRGLVKDIQEAFDRFLKKGAPAYVPKVKLPPQQAIGIILQAGGVPVLAHPYSLRLSDPRDLERVVRHLKTLGLQGIEVYYPEHGRAQTELYGRLAGELDLVVTGGTDFHGSNKPSIKLGNVSGSHPLPYSLLERLLARQRELCR